MVIIVVDDILVLVGDRIVRRVGQEKPVVILVVMVARQVVMIRCRQCNFYCQDINLKHITG